MQAVSALLPVPGLNPDKLSVTYMSSASARVKGSLRNLLSRRYTVTHNDITGQLYLSVGEDFNHVQIGALPTTDPPAAAHPSSSHPASVHPFNTWASAPHTC